jgi:hypothetical protein
MHLDRKINGAIKQNWKGFCSTIKSKVDVSENKKLLTIDFSESIVLSTNSGITQKENDFHYISIFIDQVKQYWKPSKHSQNSAEFYLNKAGFEMVSEFYAPLFSYDNDEVFKISRMAGMDSFYPFENSKFRPEFHFSYSDSKYGNETRIIKNPKIQFRYDPEVDEDKAVNYAKFVCLIGSFYTHSQIDYSFARIHLINNTITINIILTAQLSNGYNPRIFTNNIDSIFKQDWQSRTKNNFEKLNKVIEKLNQSLIVDGSSRFLLRYNIIEICKKGYNELGDEFTYLRTKKEVKKTYKNVLDLILEIVKDDEKIDFQRKWDSARKNDLKYRVMLGPLKKFLKMNNLNIDKFSINIERIKEIRDSLTHSESKIEPNELEEANNQLYWVSVILIAKLMGLVKEIISNKYITFKN